MSESVKQGAIYMLFASFCFAVMGGFAKELAHGMSAVEVVFFRNVFGVVFLLGTFWKYPLSQKGGKFWLLFFRGFMGFLALLAFFYNIAHISLAEAMTYSRLSPVFTALFAFIFLKEKLYKLGWIGIAVGFIGIVFITRPEGIYDFDKYDLLGIFSGVGAALAYTAVRELREYYDTRSIVLSFMIIGTVGPVVLMMIGSFFSPKDLDYLFAKFIAPKQSDWIWIVLLGFSATLAQVYMTKAYASTKAGIVGAISYSNIIFSIIIGMIIGDHFPDFYTLIGIFLIICAGVMVTITPKSIKTPR